MSRQDFFFPKKLNNNERLQYIHISCVVSSTYIKPCESGTQYNEEDIVSPFDYNNNIEIYVTLFSFSQGMLLSLQYTLECVLKCAYV